MKDRFVEAIGRAKEALTGTAPKNFEATLRKRLDNIERDYLNKEPMFVDRLWLSVRAANCLKAARIDYVDQLVEMTGQDLLKLRNMGKGSVKEIEEVLAEQGLQLRKEGK